jgi:alkanesulfonate monooxygenase SsuD/methylene tetrahydromethanopterin reductase-like flavin-dependent oxidoreductase (luciferase family)
VRDVRARVAFYCSTPAYYAAFEAHGLGALARELQQLSKAQRWDDMPERITDDILDLYALVGTYDEIVPKLLARYRGLVTNVEFSIPLPDAAAEDRLRGMLAAIRAA